MNPTIEILRNRVSLRKFDQAPISAEHKDLLFECAMKAPTAGNQMLYTMIDVTDADLKLKLSISCDNQPFIAKGTMIVVFIADQQRWFDYYDVDDVKGYCDLHESLVYEAPQEADLLLACEDAMCAAQNMVVAGESLGIGSCYIGDIIENHEYICNLLNLPEWTFPISMLVLGYYEADYKRNHQKRFDQKYIVHENTYRRLPEDDLIKMHNDIEKRYNKDNKYGAKNYAQQFYHRKTGADFSKEMARSVRVALKKWDGRKR